MFYFNVSALEMASPGNRHCASCIGAVSLFVLTDVAWSGCLLVSTVTSAIMAEPIKMLLGMWTLVGQGTMRVSRSIWGKGSFGEWASPSPLQ